MSRKLIETLFLCLFFAAGLSAQVLRTESMGGLSYAIVDKDHSLSPYDFGQNPAWLFEDERETRLFITPFYNNSWGDYRRPYDSEGNVTLGSTFQGIRTLGSQGTFSGYTSYIYQNRRNYYRTLKKDNYAGEGFNITDTTASDFRYMGPHVRLMYSWQPLKRVMAGGFVSYELLDGLKEKFSYAKSIFRDTHAKLGLAWRLSDALALGGDFEYFNAQESIEASDVNLYEVTLFYFRGDTYHVNLRSSSTTGKIKRSGFSAGSQLYWNAGKKLTMAAIYNYSPANARLLKPFSRTVQSTSQSFEEFEDSYSAFENHDLQWKAQYLVHDGMMLGAFAAYRNESSWSKLSQKELLYWEWELGQYTAGIGLSQNLTSNLLVGMEYEFSALHADSAKYIDSRMITRDSDNHTLRLGAEYKVNKSSCLRAGLEFGTRAYDFLYGGSDCKFLKYTGGISLPLMDSSVLYANVQYNDLAPGSGSRSRSFFSCNLSLMMFTF